MPLFVVMIVISSENKDNVFIKKNNLLVSKVLIVIFFCSIFLMYSFGVGPNLYPLRLILPFTLVYFFTVFFQKVFLLKEKVIIQPIVLLSFSFLF